MPAEVPVPVFVRPAWYDDASCQDSSPNLFYVEQGESTVTAFAVCRSCPVRVECLEMALDRREPWGVWGGMSPRQRFALIAARGRSSGAVVVALAPWHIRP